MLKFAAVMAVLRHAQNATLLVNGVDGEAVVRSYFDQLQ